MLCRVSFGGVAVHYVRMRSFRDAVHVCGLTLFWDRSGQFCRWCGPLRYVKWCLLGMAKLDSLLSNPFFFCPSLLKKLKFAFFRFLKFKNTIGPVRFASILPILQSTNLLRFANLIFGNNYVRFASLRFASLRFGFASLDSQVNVNFLCFALIIKFLNIWNMFTLLRNKFSNEFSNEHFCFTSIFKFFNLNMFASQRINFFYYRTCSLRFARFTV